MNTDVAVPETSGISTTSLAGSLKPTHYELAPHATYEDWSSHIEALSALGERVQFWIGDALITGEDRFPDRYSQMVDSTQLSRGTLHNFAWVARRFPPHRRRSNAHGEPLLSFNHYRVIAGIEDDAEQDRWLDAAIEHRWSIAELNAHRTGRAVSGAPVAERPQAESALDSVVSALSTTFKDAPLESQEFDVPAGWGTIRVLLILDDDPIDPSDYEVVEG